MTILLNGIWISDLSVFGIDTEQIKLKQKSLWIYVILWPWISCFTLVFYFLLGDSTTKPGDSPPHSCYFWQRFSPKHFVMLLTVGFLDLFDLLVHLPCTAFVVFPGPLAVFLIWILEQAWCSAHLFHVCHWQKPCLGGTSSLPQVMCCALLEFTWSLVLWSLGMNRKVHIMYFIGSSETWNPIHWGIMTVMCSPLLL